jgi:dTDP-4-amino-4,6-dideoxygalactose transaminase
VHYPVPAHRQSAYPGLQGFSLPVTERLQDEVLSLPMGPTLSADAVDRVIEACQSFVCPA